MKKKQNGEWENFGIQMRSDVRRRLNVRAAELDIEIREAIERAVVCWMSPSCVLNQISSGSQSASLSDGIAAWIASPANELERGLADIVVRLAMARRG